MAVVPNGTAVPGAGNLGPLASRPVMEGKPALPKRRDDSTSIGLGPDTQDAGTVRSAVRPLGPFLCGTDVEDMKAPERLIVGSRSGARWTAPSSATTGAGRRQSARRPS